MKIAVTCPIKPPDHPIPSGDRTIARNLMTAIALAGHKPFLASRFIAYSKRSNPDILHCRKRDALAEADRVVQTLRDNPPDLWLTYHPYDKAPDWIGPVVAAGLAIPYLTLEAAKTGQGDEWLPWREEAQAGLKKADLHLVMKPTDHAYLTELLGSDDRLWPIAPFIDTTGYPSSAMQAEGPVRLITAGLMRPGKKVENYRILADTLDYVRAEDWHLTILGDGPARSQVEQFFARHEDRMTFVGEVPRETVLDRMAQADIFVWPGWHEPVGMVYLEAQLCGLPVVAFADMGVPLVVADGETGLLAPPGDTVALAAGMDSLIADKVLRARLASAAPGKVRAEHGLEQAAHTLDAAFRSVV